VASDEGGNCVALAQLLQVPHIADAGHLLANVVKKAIEGSFAAPLDKLLSEGRRFTVHCDKGSCG